MEYEDAAGIVIDYEGDVNYEPRNSSENQPVVLDPDHPLMKRFQLALKKHLQAQNEKCDIELVELTHNLKARERERDDVGDALYNLQQEVGRQQKLLDALTKEQKNASESRIETENRLKDTRESHKELLDKANATKKKEEDFRRQLEDLSALELELRMLENNVESDLLIKQRISERAQIDKKEIIEEKWKQDMYLLKLMNRQKQLERQKMWIEDVIAGKEEELQSLRKTQVEAYTDFDALEMEVKQLQDAWQGALRSLEKRNEAFGEVKERLRKEKDDNITLEAEIAGCRRAVETEMEENEKLTSEFNMYRAELQSIALKARDQLTRQRVLQSDLSNYSAILMETENQLAKENAEISSKEHRLEVQTREIQKISREKEALEEDILEKLQDQLSQDKASQHMDHAIRRIKKKSRELEMQLSETDNNATKQELEREKQKLVNSRLHDLLEEMKIEVYKEEKKVEEMQDTIHRNMAQITKKQGTIDLQNKELAKMVAKAGGAEKSPLELKIMDLEHEIEEQSAESEKLQANWLHQQRALVELEQRRSSRNQSIDYLKKELNVLKHQMIRLEAETEAASDEESVVKRSIETLHKNIVALNVKLHREEQIGEQLDKHNLLAQGDYISALKEAEEASDNLKADLESLMEDKENLATELIATQHEALEWEKKITLVKETKKRLDAEKARGSELDAMKHEIHRMEVRFSQLVRAQEKLVQDLEQSVGRRESIVEKADAREKRGVRATRQSRIIFNKRLEDTANRIKYKTKEAKECEQHVSDLKLEKLEMEAKVEEKRKQLQELNDVVDRLKAEVNAANLEKQRNLELLVRRQKRVKMYLDAKSGKYKPVVRGGESIEADVDRQAEITQGLLEVVEQLAIDFPSLNQQLMKVRVVLQTPTL